MKVKELIEKLEQLDPDYQVLAYSEIQEADMLVEDARVKTISKDQEIDNGIEGVYYSSDPYSDYDDNFKDGQKVVVLFDYI